MNQEIIISSRHLVSELNQYGVPTTHKFETHTHVGVVCPIRRGYKGSIGCSRTGNCGRQRVMEGQKPLLHDD